MSGLIAFSHGKDSSPKATKITALRPLGERAGWRTCAPDYRGMEDPAVRVEKLVEALVDESGPVVLVGSSLGGLVSVFAAQRRPVVGMFLMAPAVYWPGYEQLDYACPVALLEIVHGWRDEIVPVETSVRLAREHSASLSVIDDDHSLCNRLEWIEQAFSSFLDRVERHLEAGQAA